MKTQAKLKSISRFISLSSRSLGPTLKEYPKEILDLVIFHKFHFFMGEKEALQAFRKLKSAFVDWNEVRISTVSEIHEVVSSIPDSLELAIFIKDLLEYLHRDRQTLSLEFLTEMNLSEIRKYLRGIKGVEPTTISLVLRLRKEHPVLPVSAPMERTFLRLGLLRPGDSRDQKEKYLHSVVEPDAALPFHHFFLQHSRLICPPQDERVQCLSCGIRSSCSFFARHRAKMNAAKINERGRLNGKAVNGATLKLRVKLREPSPSALTGRSTLNDRTEQD